MRMRCEAGAEEKFEAACGLLVAVRGFDAVAPLCARAAVCMLQ